MNLPCPFYSAPLRGERARFWSEGYSLVELLVVMAIIAILATLAAPSIVGVFQGSSISQAGQMIQDQLASYRQLALADNCTVEVRFYQFQDPNIPNDPTAGYYRAIQAFKVVQNAGTLGTYTKTPLTKALRVPVSVIIDSGNNVGLAITVSRLIVYLVAGAQYTDLGTSTQGVQNPSTDGATPPDPPLLNVGNKYTYVAFQFRPDGSTNLLPATGTAAWNYYLTVHSLSGGDSWGGLCR